MDSWRKPSRSVITKTLKESVKTGHPTGLPEKILRLFVANPPLPFLEPIPKRPPKQPYSGVGQYLDEFAAPGDPEYEPPRPEDRPPSPRKYRNPELVVQARVDAETKLEKWVGPGGARACRGGACFLGRGDEGPLCIAPP
jgi:U1 small nuclear ribonucleoprotein